MPKEESPFRQPVKRHQLFVRRASTRSCLREGKKMGNTFVYVQLKHLWAGDLEAFSWIEYPHTREIKGTFYRKVRCSSVGESPKSALTGLKGGSSFDLWRVQPSTGVGMVRLAPRRSN